MRQLYTLLATFLILGLSSQSHAVKLKFGDPLPANTFIELAKAINPTVVNISTSRLPTNRGRRLPRDPMLDMLELFGGGRFQTPRPQPMQALGTGFIIRKDGLIITNAHVIDGADIIQVSLMENPDKVYEAELIGKDRRTDIALIKISRTKAFPVAELGTSKDVQVGQWVAAFGNPYGHSNTVTKGIISAIGREIEELNRLPFLQTDASINQGNSGGPLVDTQGKVIGVNTAIDARAQGIGFAIPIDEVKTIIKELEDTGRVQRGFIGVTMDNISPRAARSLGLSRSDGVLIMDVMENSPAEKAGLQPYDVIVKFGSKKISRTSDLGNAVGDTSVGKSSKIEVIRDGDKKTFNITVGSRPDEEEFAQRGRNGLNGQEAPFDLGFEVTTVKSNMAKMYGLPENAIGKPLVIAVSPGSPSSVAGLQPGDVILDVNRKRVGKISDLMKSLKNANNFMRVMRGESQLLVVIEK